MPTISYHHYRLPPSFLQAFFPHGLFCCCSLSSCQPASHLVSVYSESALSSLPPGPQWWWGGSLKAVLELYTRGDAAAHWKPRRCKSTALSVHVRGAMCVHAVRSCSNHSHILARTLTVSHQHSLVRPFHPSPLFFYVYDSITLATVVAERNCCCSPMRSRLPLMCAPNPHYSLSQWGGKGRGVAHCDGLGDRLIAPFHQSTPSMTCGFATEKLTEAHFFYFTLPKVCHFFPPLDAPAPHPAPSNLLS